MERLAAEADGDAAFSTRPGDGAVSRADLQRDTVTGRWGQVTPAATQIGRASSPTADVSENVRRLHAERHPATQGHSARTHRLEKIRITHALANHLDLTPWQRDRAIGVMADLDLTPFGSQRAVEKVALVTIRHVVDDERERYLGLHDREWLATLDPERMTALYETFTSITDDPAFEELAEDVDLDITHLNRLRRILRDAIEEQGLEDAVFGRNPYRDPNLPASDWNENDDDEEWVDADDAVEFDGENEEHDGDDGNETDDESDEGEE
ncbi:DNA-directed RNA polymerase subunit epsilon [Halocalculus aciditolerans]|uniref:DNA-directed RNA polymerase subunit epsilon n=1 Tax=Halocalculus aciditolerans TaxID=1383812 RepID=A0A830F501_9EURY|nr:DNA-directed RNA polymerase subunit epsilon [Halocalculus aciditolerans]GGL63512.1 hypothetical protein GCM10009039_21790 [Halocalculus aciditolerans]